MGKYDIPLELLGENVCPTYVAGMNFDRPKL
jgi:hypothetical protein